MDILCDPGQFYTKFNDKGVCAKVPIDHYCYNGRCLLDCSNIDSSCGSSHGYENSCRGTTGNKCQQTYDYYGPKSSQKGSMACTPTQVSHSHSPIDCPPGSYGYGNSLTFGCYPCAIGTARGQSDSLTSCSPCSVGLVSGKGSSACYDSARSPTATPSKKRAKSRPTQKPTRKRYIYRTHSPSHQPTRKSKLY